MSLKTSSLLGLLTATEAFDGLLLRLADRYESVSIGTWDDLTAERVRKAVQRSRGSFALIRTVDLTSGVVVGQPTSVATRYGRPFPGEPCRTKIHSRPNSHDGAGATVSGMRTLNPVMYD